MTEYKRAISYTEFMALSPDIRKEHSSYFLKNRPEFCPVILSVDREGKAV